MIISRLTRGSLSCAIILILSAWQLAQAAPCGAQTMPIENAQFGGILISLSVTRSLGIGKPIEINFASACALRKGHQDYVAAVKQQDRRDDFKAGNRELLVLQNISKHHSVFLPSFL